MGRTLSRLHQLELTGWRETLKSAPWAPTLMRQPETAESAPAVAQSLGSSPAGSCLSGGRFEMSKWVPFTHAPRAV